uniref:Enoyl-CoA hydratase n=1 Tax=Tetranychus urticae TaxID=32264 RepID=T1L4E0_TETUR
MPCIPGAGGKQRLPKLIGLSKAKDLIFTGRKVSADNALSIGFFDYLASEKDEEAACNHSVNLTIDICNSAPLAVCKDRVKGLGNFKLKGLIVQNETIATTLHSRSHFRAKQQIIIFGGMRIENCVFDSTFLNPFTWSPHKKQAEFAVVQTELVEKDQFITYIDLRARFRFSSRGLPGAGS